MQIAEVIAERGCKIAVVGIPKTIDNDIPYIDQSFGFQTAFSRGDGVDPRRARRGARGARRHRPGEADGPPLGFIACYAALAKNDADFVLIPEVPFELDGERGFLAHAARRRSQDAGHAVVVVAEGAGQEHLARRAAAADASGNARLRRHPARSCSSASPRTSPRTASS